MRFADMLREARERAGLTQQALAERTGLPLRSIQNWEQGHRVPRLPVLLALARALDARPERLLLALAEEQGPTNKRKGKRK